jgi:hypothetical protein
MARLISRTQVEEQQDFIRNTSFSQNVIISGSLLVSESFSLGTNPDTKQEISGSVEITGSLTLDGPFNVVGDQALDLTASVSLESIDTRLFGGIKPEDFGAMDATIFVSSTSGNDNNDGRTQQFPVRTVKRAAEIASAGDDGRFGLDSGSLFTGFRIEVSAGTYLEDNPIELPKNTTVWGAGLRVCKVLAKNENEDLFWVNSGNYLAEMTFGGLRVFPSVDNCKSGFAVAFAPNAFITTSPYVQNCSMISNQENSFLELYETIPAGGGGLNVDGNIIHPDSPLASMVLDAYTQVAPNGVGCQVVGRGFIQLVSFFTNFSAYAVKVLDGGQAVLLNSNTSFGDFGMYASGSRFITGSGGNGDAFASVRDNYTIIIDTIEDGLSSIPELVPNTTRGIKTTSELQKFISGNSSNDVAENVKAGYQLVSSIVGSGVTNIPGLLAKSSTEGYSTGSVWNISKKEQLTGSFTASSNELNLLADRFEKVQETLEVGPRITGSYSLVDNIDGLIQVSSQSITPVGFASSQATINDSILNFKIVKDIVKNGVSAIPLFTSSNQANIKVTDTEQFITDISSSAVVQNKISSSFSIVHDILLNGTGSAPTIIESGSENPSIDYQNGYSALLGNLSFIQEETIAYLSSSWSTFDYNEVTCKRDLGYIVSGAAQDLLYGGNEESVRNGNFYYLYPSEATSSQKQQTLDAIRYAGELATRLVGDITFQEPSSEQLNAYDGIIDNKEFIQEEVIAYISSSWRGFDYDEIKCKRDVGYILDAVATDLRYGGNERSIIAGKFYYDYPSEATTTQLLQTTDGIQWASNLSKKILEASTFTTASNSVQGAYDLIVNNRELIQQETVNFIDTQYPNLVYLKDKCKRDTGFILDAVATDLLYGGNQKSIRAGLYYREVPSKVNGVQLDETLAGIIYTKNFVDDIVTNTIIKNPSLISNTTARIQAGDINFVTSSIGGTETQRANVSASIGIVEDIIKQGEDSVLAAIAGNTPGITWTTEDPILVTGISEVTSSTQLSASLSSSVTPSFDVVVKVIESGSTITNDLTIGSASNSELPVAQRGIPKDSYPSENLTSTVVGTTIPAEVTLVSNMEEGIRFNSGTQYTSSISASSVSSTDISESFSTVIDIIEYGITSSLVLSGSDGSSTYFEVVTLPNDSTAFYINQNQLQYFDGRESWGVLDNAEDTGSFLGSKKDPTLTLVRNEMYNFSINDLGTEDKSINEPFLIKTKRTAGYSDVVSGENINNNGITFGTLTFTPLYNTPDTLYYVNPNNISASGVINIVDSLPLSAEQEYVEVPSRGQFEKTLNTSENIKITNGTQYTQSLDASIANRNNISGSIDTVINILSSGSSVAPTIVKNIDGLVKRSDITQVTSSFDISSTIVNKISSSVGIVLNIIENGTGSLPTQVDNTEEYIAVGTTSQFTTSSISASFDDIQFISESFEIVARILENGSGSYETASLYVSEITASNTVAAYNLIKQNIDFIQEETIAYLSSSWSTFDYDEDKCKRDVGLITSGAAEDLINNVYSASIVNGKFYLEYPSEATGSQLNQTLDGIRYASRLAQNVASNITFGSPSQERLDTETIIRDNKEFIQEEAITFLSSSWSAFDYNDVTCKRDIGYILDATITDIVYGGNERSINAGVFYYKYPSEATGSQLFPTVDGIQYAGEVTQKVVTGSIFSEPSSTKVRAYNLVHENRELIQDEVIQYISSSWNSFDYDDVKCRRDTGYILDAATTDLIYGGNERSVIAGDFYYRYPSQATGSQLNQTVDGIVYAQRLADKMLTNTTLVTASLERREVYDLIERNREMVQAEVISYISSSWSEFEYDDVKCSRDVGHILDAVSTDLRYGGNERSVIAGEYYWRYPSEATNVQKIQTIDGIVHAARIVQKLIQNQVLQTPSTDNLAIWNLIRNNRTLIQNEVTEFIDFKYPFFTYNRVKCRRDVGYILDAILTDLIWGGNERSVIAGDFYYRYPSEATTIQLDETVDGIRYAESLVQKIIAGEEFYQPSLVLNTDGNIKVTELEPTVSSIALSGSYQTEISSSVNLITEIISGGLSYLPDVTESVDGLIKVNDITQFTSTNSGSEVESSYVTRSVGFINDIIRLGTDDIPFALAKWYDDTLDVPQNLTTGSYIEIGGGNPIDSEYNNGSIVSLTGDGSDFFKKEATVNGVRIVVAGDVGGQTAVPDAFTEKVARMFELFTDPSGSGINETFQRNLIKTLSGDTGTYHAGLPTIQRVARGAGSDYTPNFLDDAGILYWNLTNLFDTTVQNDMVWYLNSTGDISGSGDIDAQEVIEHVFHTLHMHGLPADDIKLYSYLASDWQTGDLYAAMEEAYDAGMWDSAGYGGNAWKTDSDAFEVAAKEYLYLLNFSMFEYTDLWEGGSLSPEWNDSMRTQSGILANNPLGYAFHNTYISPVISKPSLTTIRSIFQDGDLGDPTIAGASGYVVTPLSDYSTDTEFGIVSSSFGQIINIIENGTGSLPTLETNTSNYIKVSDSTQFTSVLSGSLTTINKVSASVGIVEDIVQNGVGSLPTITFNNSDKDNLIKVTSTSQFTTGSFGGELQRRLISSSIAVVTTILENGTGSLPTLVDYNTPSDSPKTLAAYNTLKENIDFIQAETIAYLSSSWSTFDYNDVSCSRDVGLIISGAAEDMLHNANSASIVNGKFYFEYPSEATSSQLNQTLDGIRYAGRMAENIVRGYTYQTASVEISGSVELIRNNKEFIQEETIEFVSSSWDNFDYNSVTCKRDVGYILDAVATDILYGGNERSVVAGRFYYDYPSSAIVGGVPSSTRQKDPTVTAIDFVQGMVTEIVSGAVFQTASNEVEYVYEAIRENREFIQNETIAFVNAKYPNLNYNEASCSRDTGFIIDAVATDLRWGGNQRALTAGEFYYRFPSKATGVQVTETTDALVYTKDLVEKIVDKETLFIPTGSLNTDNGIKVTSSSPATDGSIDNESVITTISSSFAIVSDAILNGTGSTPTASLYGSPLSDSDVVTAYGLITASVPFIQEEVVEYISSSWVGFDYDDVKCARDVGFIVNGVASDLLYGVVSASVVNAKFYYEYPSEATSSQSQQTVDGINYAYQLTEQIVKGVTFSNPSTQISASVELIRNNREFIQSESISYLSSSWEGFDYEEATCRRDVGHIVDAVATDLLYGGNQRSKIAGEFYYKYPSSATSTQLEPTTTGIKYAGDVASKLVQNEIFVTASAERLAGNKVILDNKEFISSEVIQYVSSSWSDFDYNDVKCKRDVGYILNAVATDFLYDGNERSREAGRFYYEYPSEATTIQLNQTIDGINYASSLARNVMKNETFVTASAEVSASVALLRTNRSFIQNETIEFISSSWSNVVYNEDKCRRDTGYIIDAATTDLLYGGNERSVTAGLFYWRYPSRATKGGTPSEANQLDPTVDGIRFANGTAENVVQNLEYSTPTNDTLNGVTLLRNNTTFIQKETIAYLSSSWSEFDYNEVSCSRDLGYIIDAVATDLTYGGNERAVQAGTFYYYIPSIATTEQKPQTTDGIDFAKGLAEKVVRQQQLVFAPFLNRESATALRNAKKTLQGKAISYTNAAFPNFEYLEEKCYRDTGFILDAIATDLIYGGNERSIRAAESYYNGVYGSAAVVINEQKKETAETNRYLRTQFQFVARKAPVEEFGSLIITTGHDFSYAGSGVTYKALPPNQGGDGVPDPNKEITEIGGGRVFFTSGNELGDFRIGAGLVINQATGTLQGRTFSRSLFSLVTPFSLALQD